MGALVKIAVVVLVIVGIIYLADAYWPKSEPKPESSFYDTVAEDDREFRAEPEFNEPAGRVESVTEQQSQKIVEETPHPKPQFEQLPLEEDVDAERLLEFAINQFKIGRLPGTGFKPMVDACRNIIDRYPNSIYAFKAKRILLKMPTRFRKRYKITKEELDLGGLK